MPFGYVPDYQGISFLKDIYLKIFGYPYSPKRNEAAIVFKLLEPKKEEKILDIGCGDGIWYNELRKRGFQVTGIDISNHDLNKLKDRAEKLNLEIDVIEANAQAMPFGKSVFDKVYSISTFEHIADDEKAFAEANRILKPNGFFVISVPMKKVPFLTKLAVRLPEFIKRLFYNKFVIESKTEEDYLRNFDRHYFHYRNYTIEDINSRLEKSGFTIEKKTYNCRFFGSGIWSLYHTLRIFEREKTPATDYKFRSEIAFALVAPFFYLFFLIDRLFFWTKGETIILKLRKK